MLKGELRWQTGTGRPPIEARQGDIVFVPEGLKHGITSVGDETTVRLAVTPTDMPHIYTEGDSRRPRRRETRERSRRGGHPRERPAHTARSAECPTGRTQPVRPECPAALGGVYRSAHGYRYGVRRRGWSVESEECARPSIRAAEAAALLGVNGVVWGGTAG